MLQAKESKSSDYPLDAVLLMGSTDVWLKAYWEPVSSNSATQRVCASKAFPRVSDN